MIKESANYDTAEASADARQASSRMPRPSSLAHAGARLTVPTHLDLRRYPGVVQRVQPSARPLRRDGLQLRALARCLGVARRDSRLSNT